MDAFFFFFFTTDEKKNVSSSRKLKLREEAPCCCHETAPLMAKRPRDNQYVCFLLRYRAFAPESSASTLCGRKFVYAQLADLGTCGKHESLILAHQLLNGEKQNTSPSLFAPTFMYKSLLFISYITSLFNYITYNYYIFYK